jgi:hypothetical protein
MTIQRPVAGRRLHRAVSLAAALLLASLPLAAQNRSRPSESGDTGRTAREAGPSRPSYSPPPASSAPSTPSGGDRSSASSQPRTARPSDGGEPHRQPPSRGDRDGRGRGGRGGHYYYGGGYYPYHYPYGWGNYGFWPGFYGWWWWGGYPAYGYGNYPGGYYDYDRERAGALDFDVAPARTEIYLDGQYLGKVDGFDGWPRYLWLPKGTYDVVLYLDGYKTVARQISVYPGSVIQIDDRLEPGDSIRPEDLVSKSTERRDERLRYERERRERIDRGEERGDGDEDEDWRDRVRRDRGRMEDHDRHDREADQDGDRSSRKGRLVLDVEPEDASVYLDGRFVGTASELALMRDGLPVTPGEHRLAIVRPGRKAEEREFDVEAGEEVELDIELETESR